jgi:membrane-associated protease RseP (regulator of RpoE activity)
MFVAIFVLAIAAVIMFHEFGHFATAKLFGMKAEKFFLGFGPTLWSFRRGETEYGVKALPLGGFVKIVGMNRFEPVEPSDRGRLFYEKPAWQRVIVLVAGSATHFVVAFALLWAGLAFVGAPTITTRLDELMEGSPGERAGLLPGDDLLAIDGEPVTDWRTAQRLIQQRGGETVDVVVDRDGAEQTIAVEVGAENPQGERQGYLGVIPGFEVRRYGLAGGLSQTLSGEFSYGTVTRETLAGIAGVFTPAALADFFASATSDEPRTADQGGPISLVGAGRFVNEVGTAGDIFSVLLLIASLNIVLGTLNLLPLPPLDGGHVAVLAVEEAVNAVRRPKAGQERWALDPSVVTPIALAVILFFGVIGLTAIYADIVNPIRLQ